MFSKYVVVFAVFILQILVTTAEDLNYIDGMAILNKIPMILPLFASRFKNQKCKDDFSTIKLIGPDTNHQDFCSVPRECYAEITGIISDSISGDGFVVSMARKLFGLGENPDALMLEKSLLKFVDNLCEDEKNKEHQEL